MEEQRLIWNIDKLKNWEKNPRGIKEEDFIRLKKQITKLGQYKPILITPDGTALGGNFRLKAYRDLGIKEVWVSIVEPKNEKEMVEYALSDNDRAGYYEEDKLAELMYDNPDFPYPDYKIDLGFQATLEILMKRFGPVPDDREEDTDGLEEDQLEGWINSSIKQIVLYFEGKDFEDVIKRLGEVIKAYQLKNNTEAILALLDFYESNRTGKKGD